MHPHPVGTQLAACERSEPWLIQPFVQLGVRSLQNIAAPPPNQKVRGIR